MQTLAFESSPEAIEHAEQPEKPHYLAKASLLNISLERHFQHEQFSKRPPVDCHFKLDGLPLKQRSPHLRSAKAWSAKRTQAEPDAWESFVFSPTRRSLHAVLAARHLR